MIHLPIALLALLGFALLLLAMPRHQRDWFGRTVPVEKARLLRLSGAAALLLSLAVALGAFGPGYGAIFWFGWLTLAALSVAIANSRRHASRRRVR